jgi:DNA-directed RNA polymerase specialized sigma24 family protein
MQPEPPENLTEGVRNKEDWAWEFLDQEYTPRLIALAAAKLGYAARVEIAPPEVVQSMYRSLCGDLDQIPDTPAELWGLLVFRTRNKVSKKLRDAQAQMRDFRRTRHLDTTTDLGEFVVGPAREDGPEAEVELKEDAERLRQKIRAVLQLLPPMDREIVELCLQGQTNAEIQKFVGCAERTIRRAKAKVRQALDEVQHSEENTPPS